MIKDEIKNKMQNVNFIKQGLGALEFSFPVINEDFEEKIIDFRIERVSFQTLSRIGEAKNGERVVESIIKNYIAFPVEARELKYWEMSTGALSEFSEICKEFQDSPLSIS